MAVEIYICKPGQALKEGRVEYSDSIYDRNDAEDDAKARCRRDATIAKVAYYKLSDSGDFRCFYTFTNPDVREGPAKKPRAGQAARTRKPAKRKKKPKKKTLMQKIVGVFKD